LGVPPASRGPQQRLISMQKKQEQKEDGRYIIFYSFHDEGEEEEG
jgi:hypothetical protein